VTASDDPISSFIQTSFRSVWALEILLLLEGERRVWTRPELINTLRASDLVVGSALDRLVVAGLIAVDELGAWYSPANPQTATNVEKVAHLYRTRPDSVRRQIVAATTGSASAFADAFKLRKD